MPEPPRTPDLAALLPSWELSLRAERKSAATIRTYCGGVSMFLRWCADTGAAPTLTKATAQAFLAALLDAGAEPATAHTRQRALRRFSAWLAEEGEIDADPLAGMRPVKIDTKVTPSLTEDQVRALIKACEGRDFRSRRDEAIVRLMIETGCRAGEVVAMQTTDIDLARGLATVRRGKGGRGRVIPFGPQTARAIDRYLRLRRGHPRADGPALWLGTSGRGYSYDGLYGSLGYRARLAGITDFHPHLLRHTAAHRWLAAGGSEGGLMAVAGWKRRDMVDRYTSATASDRAAAEARRLNLGEL